MSSLLPPRIDSLSLSSDANVVLDVESSESLPKRRNAHQKVIEEISSDADVVLDLPAVSNLNIPKLSLEGITIRKKSTIRILLDARLGENDKGERRLNQYLFMDVIGSGAFGTVFGAQDENTKVIYAIKEFNKNKMRKSLRNKNSFRRVKGKFGVGKASLLGNEVSEDNEEDPLLPVKGEIAVLKKLKHRNVVKLFEVLDDPMQGSLFMVFELCDKGNLMDVSINKMTTPFSEDASRYYFRQLVLGIEYLHEHEIVHRDIKPDNLLIDENNILKIVDFGVSEIFTKGADKTTKSAGSPAFFAPEMCKAHHGELSLKPIDIWAMGVTLFCMVAGRLPFASESIIDLYGIIQQNEPNYPSDLTESLKFLLERLLEKDPEKRATLDEIRINSWVVNNEPLIEKEENCKGLFRRDNITSEEIESAIKLADMKAVATV
ncbi:hypothetical protein HK096_002849, partial [Nowakowskiella sp. JEL0078]